MDGYPVVHGHGHDVRQIILALLIVVAKISKPVAQSVGRTGHDAGVDLAHGLFIGSGVLLLDDAADISAGADDAPVARRVFHVHGQDSHLVSRRLGQEAPAGCGPQERHIAKQHQYPVGVRRIRHRLLHRMPGAELLCLFDPAQLGVPERVAYRLATVPVDHAYVVGIELGGTVQHVPQQGLSGQPLEDFRQVRAHARTLAGGENDRG